MTELKRSRAMTGRLIHLHVILNISSAIYFLMVGRFVYACYWVASRIVSLDDKGKFK